MREQYTTHSLEKAASFNAVVLGHDEPDREPHPERLRADEADVVRVEPARGGGEEGAHHEDRALERGDVGPERRRGALALPDRAHRQPDRRLDEPGGHDGAPETDHPRHGIDAEVAVEGLAEHAQRRDRGEPVRSAGEPAHLQEFGSHGWDYKLHKSRIAQGSCWPVRVSGALP